ncbi:MAG TPA: hypothetical protein VII31_07945, partial [Caldimonas sp.]
MTVRHERPSAPVAAAARDNDAAALSRRRFVAGASIAGTLGAWSTLSFAGSGDAGGNRFVLVILRGGMDGLG